MRFCSGDRVDSDRLRTDENEIAKVQHMPRVATDMLLGIVSDTHDDMAAVRAAIEYFESEDVAAVIHCGDFVAPFAVAPFDTDSFDFYAVRGNNDGEWGLAAAIDAFGTFLGDADIIRFDDTSIAVYHGTSDVLVDALVTAGTADFVVHGHTHAHGVEARAGAVRVNPGGLPLSFADDAFHVATIDTAVSGVDAVTHHRL